MTQPEFCRTKIPRTQSKTRWDRGLKNCLPGRFGTEEESDQEESRGDPTQTEIVFPALRNLGESSVWLNINVFQWLAKSHGILFFGVIFIFSLPADAGGGIPPDRDRTSSHFGTSSKAPSVKGSRKQVIF